MIVHQNDRGFWTKILNNKVLQLKSYHHSTSAFCTFGILAFPDIVNAAMNKHNAEHLMMREFELFPLFNGLCICIFNSTFLEIFDPNTCYKFQYNMFRMVC